MNCFFARSVSHRIRHEETVTHPADWFVQLRPAHNPRGVGDAGAGPVRGLLGQHETTCKIQAMWHNSDDLPPELVFQKPEFLVGRIATNRSC